MYFQAQPAGGRGPPTQTPLSSPESLSGTTGCSEGSKRCSVNPDTLISKETQERGLLSKGNAGKRVPGHEDTLQRLYGLSHAVVLPTYLTTRTETRVCVQGSQGRGTPGRLVWKGFGNGR